MVLGAIFREFVGDKSDDPDDVASRVLLTMKLGGIGFTLAAIFLILLVIIEALTMMPQNLGQMMDFPSFFIYLSNSKLIRNFVL